MCASHRRQPRHELGCFHFATDTASATTGQPLRRDFKNTSFRASPRSETRKSATARILRRSARSHAAICEKIEERWTKPGLMRTFGLAFGAGTLADTRMRRRDLGRALSNFANGNEPKREECGPSAGSSLWA